MTPDWVSATSDVISALSVVVGICIAVFQLNAWRKQSLAERKADLAVEILLHAGKLKEELLYIRRPLGLRHDENGVMDDVLQTFARRLDEMKALEPIVDQLASAGIRQRAIIDNHEVDKIILCFIKKEEKLKIALQTIYDYTAKGIDIFYVNQRDNRLRQAYDLAVEDDKNNDEFRIYLRDGYEQLRRELSPTVRLK